MWREKELGNARIFSLHRLDGISADLHKSFFFSKFLHLGMLFVQKCWQNSFFFFSVFILIFRGVPDSRQLNNLVYRLSYSASPAQVWSYRRRRFQIRSCSETEQKHCMFGQNNAGLCLPICQAEHACHCERFRSSLLSYGVNVPHCLCVAKVD